MLPGSSSCVHLDYTALLQLLQPLRCETEQLTIDLLVVLTQSWTKPARLPRCLAQFWHNPRKTNASVLSRFDTDLVIFEHGTGAEMGIVDDIGRVINWPG